MGTCKLELHRGRPASHCGECYEALEELVDELEEALAEARKQAPVWAKLDEVAARVASLGERIVDEKMKEEDAKRVPLTLDELARACANIGYDLRCGACASVFFTGFALPHDEHTHTDPTVRVDPDTTAEVRWLLTTGLQTAAMNQSPEWQRRARAVLATVHVWDRPDLQTRIFMSTLKTLHGMLESGHDSMAVETLSEMLSRYVP